MRLIIPLSLALLLLAILLPLLLLGGLDPMAPPASEGADGEQAKAAAVPCFKVLTPDLGLDEAFSLQVLVGDEVLTMSMADFLYGVVAAEMPARFHPEALRAQAVAARTYTLHRMFISPSPRHPRAGVCGSYACCKAYHSSERLRERWGERYAHYSAVIRAAVRDTDGVILLYGDEPILAAFHAASYGFTEASGAIWNPLPYLQSVETFERAEDVPNHVTETALSFSEFRETVLSGVSGAVLDYDSIPYWISDLAYTESGRLSALTIGGVSVTGADFRRLFRLRSTAIRFSFDESGMVIRTGGHGHGVGMSQFGANAMARLGYGYEEILRWYYTGIRFSRMDELWMPS